MTVCRWVYPEVGLVIGDLAIHYSMVVMTSREGCTGSAHGFTVSPVIHQVHGRSVEHRRRALMRRLPSQAMSWWEPSWQTLPDCGVPVQCRRP
jgi:hypothetical protein